MLNALLSNQDLSVFPSSYADAAKAFSLAVDSLEISQPKSLKKLSYHGEGPNREPLATDLLFLGEGNEDKVLVLLSAVHGVEGFTGSAIQMDLLKRLSSGQCQIPSGLAIVMVHCVNPWGFAWCRRVDEQGIDVNRNFVDFSSPRPVNEGYNQLASAIVPNDGDLKKADQVLQQYLTNHGQIQYEKALSGGQYQFADGLFYGGIKASQARINMEYIIEQVDCRNRQVAVIDLHTGLGPYGHGEIICDHPLSSEGLSTAQRWYGDAVTIPESGLSCSVPKLGLVDYAWHDKMAANSCYVTLEFGTYPLQELLRCLREDHVVRKPGRQPPADAEAMRVTQQLKNLFYPAEAQWQMQVLLRARQVITLACHGLLNDS